MIFYVIVGALIGGIAASTSHEVFGIIAGGVMGLLFVTIATLRTRVETLREELQRIKGVSPAAAPREESDEELEKVTLESYLSPQEIEPAVSSRPAESLRANSSSQESEQVYHKPCTVGENGPAKIDTQYALVLQGGGVGILYLTIFAAFRLYDLIPTPLTFGLLVATCALSSALAVLQDSRTLAVLGVSGGFLAPILASTGNGSHVVLFSYYALLNAGIVGIAWFRTWRVLNLVGFAFTFVIGASWGARFYQPEYFATTEPFLILFFVMYSLIAVLFALRQEPELKGYVDGTLVFGTPIVAAAFQAK